MIHFSLFLLLILLQTFSSLVVSQEKPVEEIIITSSVLSNNENQLESVVEILTQIDQKSSQSLGELLDETLGVSSSDYGSAVGQISIRGLGGNRVTILSNGLEVRDVSSVGPDHSVDVDLNQIKQIEIIKGPASLLYSNGAIGGIINVVDSLPLENKETDLSVQLGLETQNVNNGKAFNAGVEKQWDSYSFQAAYKNFEATDFSIPLGAIEEHHAEEEEHAEEEHEEHDEEVTELANSDVATTTFKTRFTAYKDWGNLAVSLQTIENIYGIPYHGEHEEEHEEEEHEEEHEGERIFTTTDSKALSLQGTYFTRTPWINAVDFGFSMNAYTLTELHEEEEQDEEEHDEEEHDEHDEPTVFSNDAIELNFVLDLFDNTTAQKVSFSYVQEDIAINGEESFLNPSKSVELGLGYYARYSIGSYLFDFGGRFDQISRKGSINEEIDLVNTTSTKQNDFSDLSWIIDIERELMENLGLHINIANVANAPTATALYIEGVHLATGRYEVGNADLTSETAFNLEAALIFHSKSGNKLRFTAFNNEVSDFIYLADQDMVKDELVVAHYQQQDLTLSGYEFQVEGEIALGSGTLSWLAGRDEVIGKFADGNYAPRITPARNLFSIDYQKNGWNIEGNLKMVSKQTKLALLEEETDGYNLVDIRFNKKLVLSGSTYDFSIFANNLLDEISRNHSSFTKEQVPLPGRNIGLKFRVEL